MLQHHALETVQRTNPTVIWSIF